MFLTPTVRLNAISYWRADFKLNLQRYSVLDSELLDTRWNSSAIRDTGFTVGNCTRSRFLGNLPKTQIDLNRSMSAKACDHQLRAESTNTRRPIGIERI